MTEPRKSLPWTRRLSVRLALVVAAAMLLFHLTTPYLHEALARTMGLRDAVLPTHWVSQTLLEDAQRVREGRWAPRTEARNAFHDELRTEGVAFLWLDDQNQIIATSRSVPWQTGDTWPTPAHGQVTEIDWPGRGTRKALAVRIEHEGEVAGTLVEILVNRSLHAETHQVTPEQLDATDECRFSGTGVTLTEQEVRARDSGLETAISIAASILLALLIAFVTTRVVTRRLSALAEAAAVPVAEDAPMPGPFEERGADEVAALSRAMNAMRGRVSELVDRLAQRDAARREWIAQVSHDLRTPLTALLVCLDRAETALDEADDKHVRRDLRQVLGLARTDVDRVHSLAEDLLEIGRLDASQTLDLEPVPPGELARQAVRGLTPIADSRAIEMDTSIERGMPVLQADGNRLMRALENLLKNALRHAGTRVRLLVGEQAGGVQFEVTDDGQGFPEANGVVALDGPLPRADRDSAGLGLIVTRRVAEAHGGRIGAANRPEGGARVWIWVPVEAG